jgi:hypothetical protein
MLGPCTTRRLPRTPATTKSSSPVEKQWRDVVEVLRVSGPEMNPAYLDAWAPRLGVDALLARARASVGYGAG